MVALWDEDVHREWVLHQAYHIIHKSFKGSFWPGGIVTDIPEVIQVLRIGDLKVVTQSNLEDEDAPGNGGQIDIIDVNVEFKIRIAGCNSSERACKVSTTQKENLERI